MSLPYQYIDSEIEWIGEVPNHWKIARISQRVEKVIGGEWGSDPASELNEDSEEIVIIRVADFKDIYLNYDSPTYRAVKKTKISDRLLKENSLLLEKSGGGEKQLVGRVVEPKDLPFAAITSNFIAKLDLDTKVVRPFMNFVFHDLYNSSLNFPFVQQTTGIQNINATYYLNTKFAYPPKPEQTAIADYLDKVCTEISLLIKIKFDQLELLQKSYESSIYKVLTKGLDKGEYQNTKHSWFKEIPSHWKVVRIKDIAFLKSGESITSDSINQFDEYPVYGGNGLRGYTTSYTHNGEFALIGRQGGLCGNINYASGKFWASEHAVVVHPFNRVDTFWLGELLRIMNLNQYSNAAAQPGLAVEKIKNLYIPLPPIEDQIRISQHIKGFALKITELQENIRNQINKLQQYNKSLIHEVVTGKKQVVGFT